MEKRTEKWAAHFRSNPSTSLFGPLMTTKISETVLGGRTHQNPAFQQKKIDQKFTYKGPRAVALILAFIAISKA